MSIKQVSIFIENATGQLADVTKFIADNNINLRALCIADSQDFGIVRIICENPENTVETLSDAGFVTKITEVFAVELTDEAGSLSKALRVLADAGVEVEYTYAFLSTKKNATAYMIFRVDDNEKAIKALTDKNINIISQADIF